MWCVNGEYYYVRYRWGELTVDKNFQEPWDNIESIYRGDAGESEWDGVMSTSEMMEKTSGIMDYSHMEITS
jgi:hypothetical protein